MSGPLLCLAPHVADMSPTSPNVANLGRHCVSLRHRRGPDIPNLYQLLPTSTNQPKHTGTLAIIEFLCLSSNNNHKITDNPPTCRQMSCRFGHPADTTLSCVCDMTSDVSRHVANMTQNVAVWATKSTCRHPTCGAKLLCCNDTHVGQDLATFGDVGDMSATRRRHVELRLLTSSSSLMSVCTGLQTYHQRALWTRTRASKCSAGRTD